MFVKDIKIYVEVIDLSQSKKELEAASDDLLKPSTKMKIYEPEKEFFVEGRGINKTTASISNLISILSQFYSCRAVIAVWFKKTGFIHHGSAPLIARHVI